MKIIGIIGWKNSGKTYYVQEIIKKLRKKGYSVASIKHAHHEFDVDQPKTDSYLHRKSGSQQVIVSSAKRWVKITEVENFSEKKLDELINEFENPDMIIVEGYKKEMHPKIEIIKDGLETSSYMFTKFKNVVAIISDTKISNFKNKQFKKNQIDEIVNFILNFKNE